MAEEGFKRKLAAILSADVEGYSRLMDDDEEATVRTLKTYRSAINDLVQQYRGRIVDSPGDNILAEFTSVVDAVNCAVEIQRDIAERNTELAYNRQMQFRIGVNLGDVIEDDGNIYGDGVNIAARVESLAEAGGICISGRAYDQVLNKLGLEYESLGEHQVKNISVPIRVYRVLSHPGAAAHRVVQAKETLGRKWRKIAISTAVVIVVVAALGIWQFDQRRPVVEPASVEKMAFPLPDKPSIAVLPFENMSDDSKQDYFSDGLTDQIISTLSKLRGLFVISRSSTFTYKGKPVKIQKVAEDLGVKYVLEGSVQKTAARIRITAQLIDATSGHHIWSERYDRGHEDLFDIQDDITMEIVKALQVELIEGEQARIWQKKGTRNLMAYEKVLKGRQYHYKRTKEAIARARPLFKEAIGLDPGYALAYASLGWNYWNDARWGWAESRAESIKMANKYAHKAIELDDTLDLAHTLLGAIYVMRRQYEKSLVQMELAISLNPNSAQNNSFMAGALGCAGRWEDGIGYAEKSIRLSPTPPAWHFWILGRTYFMTGRYDKAIETFKRAVHINPDYLVVHAFLAACYSSLDRYAEAAAEADEVLRINPQFTLEAYSKTLPYKNNTDIDRYIAALRKAGLPDKPPLPLPDKPSIAVLAFDNLSGDPEQEYFSDGIAENIITALSKVGELFVIARNSSFTYKGKPVKVQQVGRELGVRYVLEGSIQKSDNRIRINVQLIDTKTAHHLWAEKYDRNLKDIFSLQDEITLRILTELRVKLTDGEQARLLYKGTENLSAYLKYLQALKYFRLQTKENNALSRRLFEEVISIDPEFPQAYTLLGATYWMDLYLDTSKPPKFLLKKAVELNRKAIALNNSIPQSHSHMGWLYTLAGNHDDAIAECEQAISLDPNSADAHLWMGYAFRYAGRHEEAVRSSEQALRLNPIPPSTYFRSLGLTYIYVGNYEDAISVIKKSLDLSPNDLLAHFSLACVYSLAGQNEDAQAEAQKVIQINPNFSLKQLSKRLKYKNQTDKELLVSAAKKAGLPD